MAVYLLHFSGRVGRPGSAGAQHYVGWCEDADLIRRFRLHQTGRSGVAIVNAFLQRGYRPVLAHVWWQGGRTLERRIKNNGHFSRRCPLCNPPAAPIQTVSQQLLQPAEQRPVEWPSTRRKRGNGGALSPGSLTGNAGWSPPAPLPASGTASRPRRDVYVHTIGGTVYGATVRPPARATQSAGTRQPSSSGTTSPPA